jgi:hypothetical protein
LLYSLLHVRDDKITVQVVSPDCAVEVSQQVGRNHDINRHVQAPDASPEVQLPAEKTTKSKVIKKEVNPFHLRGSSLVFLAIFKFCRHPLP